MERNLSLRWYRQTQNLHCQDHNYVTVPALSMKAAYRFVQQARTSFEAGQCISRGTYHATMQSEPTNSSVIIHYPRT